MLLIVSASRSEFLLPKCLNSVFISRLRDCAWFYVWSGGEDVSQVCATSRAHESCCQRFEWQLGPTVSCLSLHSIFFHFQSPSLSFAPLSLSLCLSGCKVIKLSCFILDAIQRSDTLESWLWHALATHTHLHRSAQHRHRCAEDKWVLCLCSQSRVVQRSDYQTGER